MEISNNYSTAKVWNTSNKNVSKSSKKNKWKLTDSLKEKIVDLAKKDAQDNVYMGNAFMNLRKTEVSKVAPNRAALIGKFSQSMNSGNMSAMKEVEEADKKWSRRDALCNVPKLVVKREERNKSGEWIMKVRKRIRRLILVIAATLIVHILIHLHKRICCLSVC